MAIKKNSMESWLEQAHDWLFAFDDIKLHRSLQTYRVRMLAALESGDSAGACTMLDKLMELSNRFQTARPSENNVHCTIQAECAFVAYKTGDIDKAFDLLQSSLKLCNRNNGAHFQATATWMLGCIQWDMAQDTDATLSWELSLDIYKSLKQGSEKYLSRATTRWYAARIADMEKALDEVLGAPAPKPPPKYPSYEEFGPTPGSGTPPGGASFFTEEDILRLFTISHGIKAGPFGSTSGSQGFMEVDRVQIGGRPHRIINLRGSGRVIKYVQGREYGVIKVDGDSMNAEGIDNGDSVLLQYQSTADNNDIVAAKIHEIDTVATLKKYLRRGTRAVLKFCSRNPIHKDPLGHDKQFEFDLYADSFDIIGVALAVFKPI